MVNYRVGQRMLAACGDGPANRATPSNRKRRAPRRRMDRYPRDRKRGTHTMKKTLQTMLAAGLIAAAATGAFAIDRKAPESFASVQQAKLTEMGYRDLRPLNADGTRMSAMDRHGAEVVILSDPDNGSIRQVVYVHGADK